MIERVTSKDKIMDVCIDMINEVGVWGVNMRELADACNVSVGTIYHHFTSKKNLIYLALQKNLEENFNFETNVKMNFLEYVSWLYEELKDRSGNFPSSEYVNSESISNLDSNEGKEAIENYVFKLEKYLLKVLKSDKNVREDAFSKDFPMEEFINFILMNLISMMYNGEETTIVLEIIKRSIY